MAFELLKPTFMFAPVLLHPDPMKLSIVETDVLDFAISSILSQPNTDEALYPMAYYSYKFTAWKIN